MVQVFVVVKVKHHLFTAVTLDACDFFFLVHDLSVVRVAVIFAPDNAERKVIFLDFSTFLALLTILAREWL